MSSRDKSRGVRQWRQLVSAWVAWGVLCSAVQSDASPSERAERTPAQSSKDTDGDGLRDDEEDTNRNGVQDPGETDPKHADTDRDGVHDAEEVRVGSNPLSATSRPDVPEAMWFDLVRPLGPRTGELEVNALVFVSKQGWLLAPEIEFAPASHHAFEVELPVIRGKPEAVKLAYQPTLGNLGSRGLWGAQFLTETQWARQMDATVLALFGYRASPSLSGLLMVGSRMGTRQSECSAGCALLNAAPFFEVHRLVQLGLETTTVVRKRYWEAMWMPELRLHLSRRFNAQIGAGATKVKAQKPSAVAGVRLVWERW